MYNRNDNAYGDERRRWNADDRYTQSSRYQDTGISSGLRGNDYQSRQSLMSTNYDDIRSFNPNSGRVALLQENEMRRQETLERRSDSYGSGGQYGGFRERGDRPRKSVYDEGPYHRQETERYPPRREEPLRGRGLLGEPEQQFLRPQPNMVHQMESEAKLALANTLINALVQSQQQPVLPTPAPLMAQPLMNASLFGGGVRGRRDEPRYRRDEARGYGQKMTRKVKPRKKLHIEIPAWQKYYALLHFLIMIPAYEMFAGSVKLLTTIQIIGFSLYFLFSLTSIGMIYDNHPMSAICEIVRSAVFMVLTSIYTFGINSSVLMAFRIYFVLSALCWSVLRQVNLSEEKKDI